MFLFLLTDINKTHIFFLEFERHRNMSDRERKLTFVVSSLRVAKGTWSLLFRHDDVVLVTRHYVRRLLLQSQLFVVSAFLGRARYMRVCISQYGIKIRLKDNSRKENVPTKNKKKP